MKIINIYNKIANGEEVPKQIKYRDWIYNWNENAKDYECGNDWLEERICDDFKTFLNDEVEVIEDNKKIENITTFYDDTLEEYIAETKINGNRIKEHYGSPFEQMVLNKLKELIDEINKLKENK